MPFNTHSLVRTEQSYHAPTLNSRYTHHCQPHASRPVGSTADPDVFVATEFRNSLSAAILDSLSQHLLVVILSTCPALLLAFRISRPGSVVTSRLIRALFSTSAFLYFPSLGLWTSVVTTVLVFLLRQTRDVEHLLQRLCHAVTTPLVDRLSLCTSAAVALSDLQSDLRRSASVVRRREALVAFLGRRSPLRALVRVLTAFGIRAALAALAYVAESRFRDAIASAQSTRCKRLSRSVVIAILRAEMVSAVLLPFKTSVKMYLYGTLFVAALFMCAPVWLLW